jgi:hypothetical protein
MTKVAASLGGYMPGAEPRFEDPGKAQDVYVSTLIPIPNHGLLLFESNKYLSTRELLALARPRTTRV